MAEPNTAEGQVAEAPTGPETTTQGTSGASPDSTSGQSATPAQTTDSGPEQESFFDPKSIEGKPELEAAYKQMLSAYRKKTADIAKGKDKLKQYDEFMSAPLESMRKLAQQMGWNLVQASEDQKKDGKQFKTWDDVMAEAKRQVMGELEPMMGELHNLKRQNIESFLDSNHSDWRSYEDEMMANLQAHPSLVNDPSKLYQMSVPPEVIQARALKEAQRKLEGDTTKINGQSSTSRQVSETAKATNLTEAVAIAKQRLAQKGIRAPTEH